MKDNITKSGDEPSSVKTAGQTAEDAVMAKNTAADEEVALSLEGLLKAGAHFGHKSSRWNPKMAPFIFTVRNRFHIIDLEKTLQKIREAQAFVREVVKSGGSVLFVGTKRQAKHIVKQAALDAGMPYVDERWLGGTLTNFKTIQKSIRKMSDLENILGGPRVSNYTKKERLMMERELQKSRLLFEGIREMKRLPDAIFVVDTIEENIAVKEAIVSHVKVIGITDSNSDPSQIDYPIPANDDATKTIKLICKAISEAVVEAKNAVPKEASVPKK